MSMYKRHPRAVLQHALGGRTGYALGCHGPCVTRVCCRVQESLGGYGEEGAFPATASTAAAQQALTQSRQRRDERALDKGASSLSSSGPSVSPAGVTCIN